LRAIGSIVGLKPVGIALDHRGHLTFDDLLQPLTATSTITSPQSKPSACIAFTISKGHR
jgi:hypothetical protein